MKKDKIISAVVGTLYDLDVQAFEGGKIKLWVEVDDSPLATIKLSVDGSEFRTHTKVYTRVKE